MTKNLTLNNIVQTVNRGTLLFQEVDKDRKIQTSIAIQTNNPDDVKSFTVGVVYTIEISPVSDVLAVG